MDFADKITALARRTDNVAHLQTEEATKMALVVPWPISRTGRRSPRWWG